MSAPRNQRLPAAAAELLSLAGSQFDRVPADTVDLMVAQMDVLIRALRNVAVAARASSTRAAS